MLRTTCFSDGFPKGVHFLSQDVWMRLSARLSLTRRESQIVYLLTANHTEEAVGTILVISSHTVHSHVERLYRKLQVQSRSELMIRVFEAYVGMHPPDTELDSSESG
jgi:DNA-binding CsgD family transcriptional regulator